MTIIERPSVSFPDLQGDRVTITPGNETLWIECILTVDGKGDNYGGLHLHREHVQKLADHLNAWLTTGSLEVAR